LLQLTGSEANNNAFIMCMGDKVVVEFSKKGNAVYRYSRGQLDLDSARRTIDVGELRRDQTQRLIHNNTRDETWQERFANALRRASPHPASRVTVILPEREGSFQEISAFARAAKISMEDHRRKGGSLWLMASDTDYKVNRQLIAWGFKYRAGRGWWRAA
jgi:hypothetical protein